MTVVSLASSRVIAEGVADVLAGGTVFMSALSRGGNSGSSSSTSERNFSQDKLLSKGEIKELQENGYDVHELKGGKNASRFDLYKDREGNIYVKPKGGGGDGDPTGININDL